VNRWWSTASPIDPLREYSEQFQTLHNDAPELEKAFVTCRRPELWVLVVPSAAGVTTVAATPTSDPAFTQPSPSGALPGLAEDGACADMRPMVGG
jgi:hypothetical protein